MFSFSATDLLILALFIFSVLILLATLVLVNALKVMLKERVNPTASVPNVAPEPLDYEVWLATEKQKPSIWTKLLSLKPIEEEESLIIPHAYDGIHELNNPVPRWFSVLFYGTIIFAACYLYYYHIGDGLRQDEEYVAEVEKATADKKAFLAMAAENFDENTVKRDPGLIAAGKGIFAGNCVACHGDNGQGLVGPNLTDEFWLHGGTVNEIFKTVKYGVPEKGMMSWEKNLSAKNIAEVVNYILSLQGTNPANAKAAQGEKFEVKNATDSVRNESTNKNQ